MKCPQLSKPEATAARNQNSIGDRTEKKPWEKPGTNEKRMKSLASYQQTACGNIDSEILFAQNWLVKVI